MNVVSDDSCSSLAPAPALALVPWPSELTLTDGLLTFRSSIPSVVFIAFEKPYDPLEITLAIVADLKATGISHTRYTNRLSPVLETWYVAHPGYPRGDQTTYLTLAIYRDCVVTHSHSMRLIPCRCV